MRKASYVRRMANLPCRIFFLSCVKSNRLGVIEDFYDKEKRNLDWLDRLFRNYPKITPTRFLAPAPIRPPKKPQRIIRPFVLIGVCLVFLLFLLWPLLIVLADWAFSNMPGPGGLLFSLFYLVAGYLNLRFLIQNRDSYKVRIDHLGVTVRGYLSRWRDIDDTCVLTRSAGRGKIMHLVLFKKDGSVEKINLTFTVVGEVKIAKIVEQYKADYAPAMAGKP